MKIFLTSSASIVMDAVINKFPKPARGCKLAFVPTAGDPYGDNKPWMDADRAKLVELGFVVENFDLKSKTEKETEEILSKFDVVFVAGGNSFHLLNEANKSGFSKIVPDLVKNGLIYIGSSAGNYIACPTIEAADWKKADKNIVNIQDLSALNLVDFIVVCHYTDEHKNIVEEGRKTTTRNVITLTDDQFIAVDEKGYEIISV